MPKPKKQIRVAVTGYFESTCEYTVSKGCGSTIDAAVLNAIGNGISPEGEAFVLGDVFVAPVKILPNYELRALKGQQNGDRRLTFG
ncbi:MAG: hypothetical protein ACYDCM_07335 [Candidatus Acidiferrales bacterium]